MNLVHESGARRRESSVTLSRRGLIGGLIGIIAAPAIVRAASLMPVKAFSYRTTGAYDDYLERQGVRLALERLHFYESIGSAAVEDFVPLLHSSVYKEIIARRNPISLTRLRRNQNASL